MKAGDAVVRHGQRPSIGLFQSAPADEGGRCWCTACSPATASCFNPRPPMKAGDALTAALPAPLPVMFQSAPADEGGRC